MPPRKIAEAPKLAKISAYMGDFFLTLAWDPGTGKKVGFWKPSPPLANPYNDDWARAHQPVSYVDVLTKAQMTVPPVQSQPPPLHPSPPPSSAEMATYARGHLLLSGEDGV